MTNVVETSLSESSDAHAQHKSISMFPGSSFTICLNGFFFQNLPFFPIRASLSKDDNTRAKR